jgi:hypothetical protein
MCLQCGFYNGRQVIDLQAQKDSRTARMQAKKDAIKLQTGATEPEPLTETPAVKEKK